MFNEWNMTAFAWNDDDSEGFNERQVMTATSSDDDVVEFDLSREQALALAERIMAEVADGNNVTLRMEK